MKINIERLSERGKSDHGWLKSRFSFSFADYYNPKRMGFGVLRVLNDDIIKPSKGFGSHPHSNMEIITIPLKGTLAHKDSTGKEETLTVGEVQVMSAGSGIVHSEYNHSAKEDAELFQIWIEPKKDNIKPRHESKSIKLKNDSLTALVSSVDNSIKDTLTIYQDAKILYGKFGKDKSINYEIEENKGLFIMIINGNIQIGKETLNDRDSAEITETSKVPIKTTKASEFILVEVPLT